MKSIKTCIFIAALCCILPASAQKMFASAKYDAMCSYYGESIENTITAYEADNRAEEVVKNIMSVIGLRANFELRVANVPNAAAVIIKNKRYILYNPEFMNTVNSVSGTNWAAISILAHEIGHHLNGHTLGSEGSRPATELEADEFSGFVLRKMGASLKDAQAAMALIASMKGSHTHPAKQLRLSSIETGWANAGRGGVITSPTDVITQRPAVAARTTSKRTAPAHTVQKPVKEKLALDEKYIAGEVSLTGDPDGRYFITKKAHFVQVTKDNIYLLGSLEESDRYGYKFMLSDKFNNNIYIDNNGGLVNSYGSRIGRLSVK
jgi:hypothetical protein